MDRTWDMNPGDGVALTLVVSRRALGDPRWVTRLPLLAAMALADHLRKFVSDSNTVTVKWPNDVQIDGRKVAGILIEALDDDRIAVGIGVNVKGTPGGLSPGSTVALTDAGVALDAADLVTTLAEAVVTHAELIDDDATLQLLAATLDTLGRDVRLELPDGRVVVGHATTIGESGSLIVAVDGQPTEFVAADVTHLRLAGK